MSVGALWTPSAEHQFTVDNFGANPSTTPGTSVTPGASNAEGNWTEILGDLTDDVVGFYLRVFAGATAGQVKSHLLDIGVDPAGGTSYAAILSNLVCGQSAAQAAGIGHNFFFPLGIRAGGAVAARIQGSNGTAGSVRVAIKAYGRSSAPWLLPVGQYTETLGSITNSSGAAFTPGNAADGTWVSLGTTSRDLWWWQLGYQIDDSTMTANRVTYIELGAGASGSQRVLLRRYSMVPTTGEDTGDFAVTGVLWHEADHPVPAGTEMWVRGRCDAGPDSGFNAVAIGVG